MLKRIILFVALLLVINIKDFDSVKAFNLSPVPSIVLRDPQLSTQIAKSRSSYFGYAVVLREKSVLVGAPRSQCTQWPSWTGKNSNETGEIYKCNLATASTSSCQPFVFTDGVDKSSSNYLKYAIKNNQYLGAAMDGGTKETDPFIACAPHFAGGYDFIVERNQYMHGICYWSQNTLGDQPVKSYNWIIQPLIKSDLQTFSMSRQKGYYYQLAEEGFSVHAVSNNREFLIGAPGIQTWQGSVIHFDASSNHVKIPKQILGDTAFNTYVGYAVASGHLDSTDRTKISYLATIPRADDTNQMGKAYIFDFINDNQIEDHPKELKGSQYGEFFGYSALVEDINGDGLDDVVISAPLYNSDEEIETGAVYVFINRLDTDFRKVHLISPFATSGRFGTTITSLGDINLDGYKDIAIGAPFAFGNGAVAIYLGGPWGLRKTPNQVLNSTEFSSSNEKFAAGSMFGHALSKGADIDKNGYNDLAVGAPNAETVFIYKSYPVVKIEASINGVKPVLQADVEKFEIEICYRIITNSTVLQQQQLAFNVIVDARMKRVTLNANQSEQLAFEVTATLYRECKTYSATVNQKLMIPIEMMLSYSLIHDASKTNAKEFCTYCAIVDPRAPSVAYGKIKYDNKCKNEICTVDVKIHAIEMPETVMLGTSDIITIKYKIENSGEEAYNVQLTLLNSLQLRLLKKPGICKKAVENSNYICTLAELKPLKDSMTLELGFDIRYIMGKPKQLTVEAVVSSTGNETQPNNNILTNVIQLHRYSEVEIIGETSNTNETAYVTLEKDGNKTEVVYNIKIHNIGPSTIIPLQVRVSMPVAFINSKNKDILPFIDMTKAQLYPTLNDFHFQPKQFTQNNDNSNLTYDLMKLHEFVRKNDLQSANTIILNCSKPETMICAESIWEYSYFTSNSNLTLQLKYEVEEKYLAQLKEFFVFLVYVDINSYDENISEYNIRKFLNPSVFVNIQPDKMALWIYIAASISGLLCFILLTYALVKMGFFKRQTKEDMEEKLMRKEEICAMRAEMDKYM